VIIDTARNCANYMKLVSHSPHGVNTVPGGLGGRLPAYESADYKKALLRLVRVWRGTFGLLKGFSRSLSAGAKTVRASLEGPP
jgi:hypothetical protein